MTGQPGFVSDRYVALSAAGDPLERLASVVDFEVLRGSLVAALRRSGGGKAGRLPFTTSNIMAKVNEGADPKAFQSVDLAFPMFGYRTTPVSTGRAD